MIYWVIWQATMVANENSFPFASRVKTLEAFAGDLVRGLSLNLKLNVLYFTPCHEKAQGDDSHRALLSSMRGIDLSVIDDICCGSGGTFGMKAKNAKTSEALRQQLKRRIVALKPTTIVSPCGMCREQLKTVTRAKVVHPVEIYHRALGKAKA